jgi:3-hexulose-6-phosphate synthase/6-phospho-3-hexuloisomerase
MNKVSKPLLQVAIDTLDLDRAVEIAKIAYLAGADIIEAGTPLIKKFGILAIKRIREELPRTKIFADMKVADASEIELRLAMEAGADIVSVLASADDNTIIDSIMFGKRNGIEICIDFIGVKDVINRLMEIFYVKPDYICYHIPYDLSKKSQVNIANSVRIVKELVRMSGTLVSVAGGLDYNTIPLFANAGVSVLVIGRTITKSENIEEAVKKIKNLLAQSLP